MRNKYWRLRRAGSNVIGRKYDCRRRITRTSMPYRKKMNPLISQVLEAAMLICFGLSWPTNAYKNYQARTAAGTSWQFIMLITVGYFAGIAAKIVSGSINWVLAIYILNLVFLAANWGVYFRNRALDKARVAQGAAATAAATANATHELKNVVFATDGSEQSVKAAVFAARTLDLADAKVRVLACAPDASAETKAGQCASTTAHALEQEGLAAICATRTGNPAAEIVAGADDCSADLVVMGSRGLTGLKTVLLGSVSRAVSENAGCPVLIVR